MSYTRSSDSSSASRHLAADANVARGRFFQGEATLYSSLYSPLEKLLASGGDTRLELNPRTGRNRYECWPRPHTAIPFGSCTSSSVSERGYAAAQAAHHAICRASDSRAAANEYANFVRHRLRELLTLPDDVDIALAPSGTDVEMLALALAAGTGNRPVVNIVVGPSEVGSGTPLAAACCHYDTLVPSGLRVKVGEPVDAGLASAVDVRTVELRTDVLVAGGGMSGVCAAIAAARNGARVILVQDRSRLGGNSSSEVRMHIVGANWHKNRPGWREGGILEELRLDDATNNHQRCRELWDLLLYDKVVATRADNILTFDLRLPAWPFFAVAWVGDAAAVILISVRAYRLIFHPERLARPPQVQAVE